MKIAVYYNLAYGGAKRSVQHHVKGLKELGHSVDVYTHDTENDSFNPSIFADIEYKYYFKRANIKLPIIGRLISDLEVFTKLKKLHKKIAEDIDRKNYDFVLVHTDTLTQSPYILRFLKTKNVYYCLEPLRMVYEYSLRPSDSLNHLNKIYEYINRSIRKKIDRTNARSAAQTLAISLFGREYMIHAYNLYPQILYLGVDDKLFKPQKISKKNQILFVAEKEYIYGYELAQAALDLIPKNLKPELKIVFGTKKEQRISDSELVKLYNESIATLSLSRFDTFGLIPLESMACATPVISLNVAGYRETMLDNKTGFLTEFDPVEIAEKIIYFIKNPEKAKAMGKTGREWVVKNWTWNQKIKELERLLIISSIKSPS